MRPLSFLFGVLFGSATAVVLGLIFVVISYLSLGLNHPRVAAEWTTLSISLTLFLVIDLFAGASFYTELKTWRWRFCIHALTFSSVLAVGLFFWPRT